MVKRRIEDLPPDDREPALIKAAQDGDREAFNALVQEYGPGVLRYLTGMCGSYVDAEDLTQETFLSAFRSIKTFQDGTSFRAWLLTIAYHSWVRSRRRKSVVVRDSGAFEAMPSPEIKAESESNELTHAFRQVLSSLPEDQRTVVLLRFGENLSHSEIAEITDTEESTVRWRLYRARQKLRKVLKVWAPENKKRAEEQ